MNRLIEIGFKYAGNWTITGEKLRCNLTDYAVTKNVLYAFISNGDIKYIGKTTQQLRTRFSGYKSPGSSQSTNINNNANIRTMLTRKSPVDIFVLPDNGLLNYGGFPINLAAGLEDALIEQISPLWNGGKREKDENTDENIDRDLSVELSELSSKETFDIKIGHAYYNQGFFNISVKHQELLGSNGEEITIYLGDKTSILSGYINRTANPNATPRIMGGKKLSIWIKQNFKQGDYMRVLVFSRCSIMIQVVEI
tara:strand:- start:10262 stop:11020 length:759 start_codon:yes stop_codon:yes gene_type:complete